MSKLISNKVKKIPSTEVSSERYNFLSLAEAEPDLGVPSTSGYLLSSDTSGNRSWVANINQSVNTDSNVTFNALEVTTTITHGGIVLTSGSNIDQLTTITKTLTLESDWIDTGISGTDLATGTYAVQLYANDISSGGSNNNEYYSGVMSWYAGGTSSSSELPTDEIVLHRAGASGDGSLYLRTFRSNTASNLKLQIYSNQDNASSANYVFKFRRII